MNVGITIDVKDVLNGLSVLDKDLRRAVANAIAKSALLVEGQAKRNSPVDTGRMRSSIFSQISDLTASIMPNVYYAQFVHFGTRYIKANPFMYNALDEKAKDITNVFDSEINKAVDNFNK